MEAVGRTRHFRWHWTRPAVQLPPKEPSKFLGDIKPSTWELDFVPMLYGSYELSSWFIGSKSQRSCRQGIASENQRVPLAIAISLYPARSRSLTPATFCNLFLEPSSVRALVPLTWNHHKTAESATSTERNENYFQINLHIAYTCNLIKCRIQSQHKTNIKGRTGTSKRPRARVLHMCRCYEWMHHKMYPDNVL